jgi:hypothetical protein
MFDVRRLTFDVSTTRIKREPRKQWSPRAREGAGKRIVAPSLGSEAYTTPPDCGTERSRSYHRGVDLISDVLPFGRLRYGGAGCDQLRKVFSR